MKNGPDDGAGVVRAYVASVWWVCLMREFRWLEVVGLWIQAVCPEIWVVSNVWMRTAATAWRSTTNV